MFTKKKLSIFLLITGVILSLCGVYCCYQKIEILICIALFASGALMIGVGSYRLGSMKGGSAHSFTLDFSEKKAEGFRNITNRHGV